MATRQRDQGGPVFILLVFSGLSVVIMMVMGVRLNCITP